MRMLVEWPFWRGVVTVGTSLVVVLIVIFTQPYFKFISNVLICVIWSMFAGIRFCMELGHSIA
jgi:hypothetical protein